MRTGVLVPIFRVHIIRAWKMVGVHAPLQRRKGENKGGNQPVHPKKNRGPWIGKKKNGGFARGGSRDGERQLAQSIVFIKNMKNGFLQMKIKHFPKKNNLILRNPACF